MFQKEKELFSELISIVTQLRGPQGCLWDKKQTLNSMVINILDEAQEIKEAVDNKNSQNLCEELGDLLMDILLEIQIAKEEGLFDYQQVLNGAKEKFIRRHPHVFSDVQVNSAEEALAVWKKMKQMERENNNE
ncbi:MAG: MazG nucleotide pyrophosphohydrolase domain-containing protein [Atribacterota bacterium]|jgi:MazG family protein|nr:MazG nucleotide pyrophosphohydrolase domain-containing protein [Atribacterota bacterium]MDD4896984.1 MazG nucleotide pyrophosphohydrolase domain-containing protein [Atribacterota bacterium]MDD5637852.1 MazG nucleotide pyrophosphohydrolase domain-containing protein [Atribacterota bacterium]